MPRISWVTPGLCVCVLMCAAAARAEDWPQWMGKNRDGVWTETGIVDAFPAGGPRIRWRANIAGGYAGPAVAEGRVFVTDYVTEGDKTPDPGKRNELIGSERVLCFDAQTGKPLWTHEYSCRYKISYPAGPRATPTVSGDKVYTLGAEGHLFCLNVATGEVVWSHDLKTEYRVDTPQWGFTGHPLCVGDVLFCLVGGEGSVAVAFDKDTGREIWRALSASEPGYSPPTMIEAGGKLQLLIWHAESINGLDPATGAVHWSVPLKPDYGMSIMAPRMWQNYLFAGGIGHQSLLLRLAADRPAAAEVWRGTPKNSLYPVCSTPFIDDGVLYGCCQEGQLRGVKLETGERLWETFKPTTGKGRAGSATAFLVKNGGRFFLMSETGDLIIAKLTPEGYQEISRGHLLEPTGTAFGRDVVWSHPAFANRSVYARNDRELVCASLAKD